MRRKLILAIRGTQSVLSSPNWSAQMADADRNRAIPVSAEDFEELCAALADLIVQVSAEPEGRMSGLSDQGTRLNWYMQLMPVRDRARAILAKVRQP